MEETKDAVRNQYLRMAKTFVAEEREDDEEIDVGSAKLVGFISMLGNEIGGLFVDPGHHRSGVGE